VNGGSLRLGVILGGALLATTERAGLLPGLAREAEAAGIDLIAMPDHVALGPSTDRYPYGSFPSSPASPYPEPLTMLAAVAAVTSRIELLPSTLIVPLRPAVLLAKTCATLDVISGGRLVLGAGTGWHEPEFDAVGVPFAGRGERMDDALRACRALWRSSPASFSSPTVSFEGLHCEPRPLRPEGVRIWVGGGSVTRTARRVADYAQGWIPPPTMSASSIAEGVARIRAEAGVAALDVAFSLPVLDEGLERSLEAAVPALAAARVTVLNVPAGRFAASPDEAPAFFERLAAAFSPYR
jgi:probable F420-dependent oxidoreductase